MRQIDYIYSSWSLSSRIRIWYCQWTHVAWYQSYNFFQCFVRIFVCFLFINTSFLLGVLSPRGAALRAVILSGRHHVGPPRQRASTNTSIHTHQTLSEQFQIFRWSSRFASPFGTPRSIIPTRSQTPPLHRNFRQRRYIWTRQCVSVSFCSFMQILKHNFPFQAIYSSTRLAREAPY